MILLYILIEFFYKISQPIFFSEVFLWGTVTFYASMKIKTFSRRFHELIIIKFSSIYCEKTCIFFDLVRSDSKTARKIV